MAIRVLIDAEHLALTEQLFDAALGELGVVARGQPCILVSGKRDFGWVWFDLEASWALAGGGQPTPTCKRAWSSCGGHRRDFTLLLGLFFVAVGGLVGLLSRCSVLLSGLLLGSLPWYCQV